MIKLRDARKDDISFILEAFKQIKIASGQEPKIKTTSQQLEQDLFADNAKSFTLVAEKDSKKIGFALYSTVYYSSGLSMYVAQIYVDEQFRGQGVFSSMFEHIKQVAEQQGCKSISWMTEPENLNAKNIYAKKAQGVHHLAYSIDL